MEFYQFQIRLLSLFDGFFLMPYSDELVELASRCGALTS